MTHVQVFFRESLSKATFERKLSSVSLDLAIHVTWHIQRQSDKWTQPASLLTLHNHLLPILRHMQLVHCTFTFGTVCGLRQMPKNQWKASPRWVISVSRCVLLMNSELIIRGRSQQCLYTGSTFSTDCTQLRRCLLEGRETSHWVEQMQHRDAGW